MQLVLEGTLQRKLKNAISEDTRGLDIGPSAIVALGEEDALLAQFCAVSGAAERDQACTTSRGSEPPGDDPGQLQGAMRKVEKGSRKWRRSNHYKKSINTLDIRQAKAARPAAEPQLVRVMSRTTQTAKLRAFASRLSCLSVKNGSITIAVVDVAAGKRESYKVIIGFFGFAVRTSCF